jgi:hypothetical protein
MAPESIHHAEPAYGRKRKVAVSGRRDLWGRLRRPQLENPAVAIVAVRVAETTFSIIQRKSEVNLDVRNTLCPPW